MRIIAMLPRASTCLLLGAMAIIAEPAAGQEVAQGAEPASTMPPQIEANGAPGGSVTNRPADIPRIDTVVPAVGSAPMPQRYRIEVGVMPRKISNYFEAQNDFNATYVAPKASPHVITISGSFAYDLVSNQKTTLTAGLRIRHNFFTNLDGADSNEFDATLNYKTKPDEFRLEVYRKPARLAGIINGHNVYAATNRVSAEYRHRLTKHWRVGAGYEFSRENYTERQEHDLSRNVVNGNVQYQIVPWFEPGIGIEYERGDGRSDNFTYDQVAPVISLNSSIWPLAYMGISYKWYDRKYIGAAATDSNYQRLDKRQNVSFYGTFQLGHGFSLFSFAYYTKSKSNQPSSTFNSYDAGLGLFYRFH